MKQFFNSLFAIFDKTKSMSKHSKLMFITTLIIGIIINVIFSTFSSMLLTVILMTIYEFCYGFVPTRTITWKKFNFKIFDFKTWKNNINNLQFEQHNHIEKQDFINIISALVIFLLLKIMLCL